MTERARDRSAAGFDFDDRQPFLMARSSLHITLCGQDFVADPSGALYWPGEDTLIVSDLHLERVPEPSGGSSVAPHTDAAVTLARLEAILDRLGPARVIILEGGFGAREAGSVPGEEQRGLLQALQRGREWYWVVGDAGHEIPDGIEGRRCPGVTLGRIRIRHSPVAGPSSREIAGALHPVASLSRRGEPARGKCFVSNGERMVLPAFGAYSGGRNILNPAFSPLFGLGELRIWMLGREGVFSVSRAELMADPDRHPAGELA